MFRSYTRRQVKILVRSYYLFYLFIFLGILMHKMSTIMFTVYYALLKFLLRSGLGNATKTTDINSSKTLQQMQQLHKDTLLSTANLY